MSVPFPIVFGVALFQGTDGHSRSLSVNDSPPAERQGDMPDSTVPQREEKKVARVRRVPALMAGDDLASQHLLMGVSRKAPSELPINPLCEPAAIDSVLAGSAPDIRGPQPGESDFRYAIHQAGFPRGRFRQNGIRIGEARFIAGNPP